MFELQQYPFLDAKINKKYRHGQPFTSPFWFNSFISCPKLYRDYYVINQEFVFKLCAA